MSLKYFLFIKFIILFLMQNMYAVHPISQTAVTSSNQEEINKLLDKINQKLPEIKVKIGLLESEILSLKQEATNPDLTEEEFLAATTLTKEQITGKNLITQEVKNIFTEKIGTDESKIIEYNGEKINIQSFFCFYYKLKLAFLEEQQRKIKNIIFEDKIQPINTKLFDKVKDEIISLLKTQGLVDNDYKAVAFVPNSTYAQQIIIIDNQSALPVAAKVFYQMSFFEKEILEIDELNIFSATINELRNKCTKDLPILAFPSSTIKLANDRIGVILMPKAEGESLGKLLDGISSKTDQEIEEIYTHIGEQNGNFIAISIEHDGHFYHHSDAHLENFYYSVAKKQLYWIDLGGMKKIKATPDNVTALAIGCHTYNFTTRHLARINMGRSKDINEMKSIVLAYKSMLRGYIKALPSYKEEFINEYNKMINMTFIGFSPERKLYDPNKIHSIKLIKEKFNLNDSEVIKAFPESLFTI